jgi:hypothetical protein
LSRIAFCWSILVMVAVNQLGLASPAPSAPDQADRSGAWEPVGLSGGGALFAPAISPVDPNLMMLNCDMSAAYVSEDGGRN